MKLLSLVATMAFLIPAASHAGGNVLNGPKNCRSLMGESYEGGDNRVGRFEELCTKLEQGDSLTDGEIRTLRESNVEVGRQRDGE